MSNIKLITVASHLEVTGLHKLVQSLDKQQFHYIVLNTEWKGFGTKLLTVRDYLLANPDITHFFFADAYDVVCLGSMEEALSKLEKISGNDKMIVSAERGCWPNPDYERFYPNIFEHGYNYLNSGLYYSPTQIFLNLFEKEPPVYNSDDQLWLTEKFLFDENSDIVLDNNCEVFQSYSFIEDGDYEYSEDGVFNAKTGTWPILVHGNGRSDLTKIYELI